MVEEIVFFVVGVGYLVGEEGVIVLLCKVGYIMIFV